MTGKPLRSEPPIHRILLTCEHGGNRIPRRYAEVFRHDHPLLHGHRGYDLGALRLARRIQRACAAPLIASVTSRLLIDLNRSLHHPDLFSHLSRALPDDERENIIDAFYRPYREEVEQTIARWIRARRSVLHIGVHSFTPRLRGIVRRADVGLLYDPRRRAERSFCDRWRAVLRDLDPTIRVRRNYPYRGDADGLTTYLRSRFRTRYLGIELEVNNRLLDEKRAVPITNTITSSLHRLLRTHATGDHRTSA